MSTNLISLVSKLSRIIAFQTLAIIVLIIVVIWLVAIPSNTKQAVNVAGKKDGPELTETFVPEFSEAGKAGKALFRNNCASCHAIERKLVGPPLAGAEERAPSKETLYRWIRNSTDVLKEGDPYYTQLFNKYNKSLMTPMGHLSDQDIDAILTYVKEGTPYSTMP